LMLAVLLMCQVSNEAEVEFLPVWNPTEEVLLFSSLMFLNYSIIQLSEM